MADQRDEAPQTPPKSAGPAGRATFFDDPMIDHLLATITNLTMELSVTRERLDSLERLLAQQGTVAAGAVDAMRHDRDAQRQRAGQRTQLVASVFANITEELRTAPPAVPDPD